MAGRLLPQTSTLVTSGLESQWKPSTASGRRAFSPCIKLDTSTASLESEAASTVWDTTVVVSAAVSAELLALHPPAVSAPATSAIAPSH